jgi:hypothetical protein
MHFFEKMESMEIGLKDLGAGAEFFSNLVSVR